MRILVTGAAGFIGAMTSLELANRGHNVLAVDNFSPYYAVELKEMRSDYFLSHPRIELRKCKLEIEEEVKDLFQKEEFSSVLHLAAQPGVRVPISNWSQYTTDNIVAFSNVLLQVAQSKTDSFVYASSSSVYGNSKDVKFNEFTSPTSPVSFYGGTKLVNEELAKSVSKTLGLKTRGLRFFTVYGPWGRPDMVYFRMLTSALTGSPFSFFGDGNLERDFTFISDVASITCDLLVELKQRSEVVSDVVNVGGSNPLSINQLLEIAESVSGVSIPYIREHAHKSDVSRTNADFDYLKSLLGSYPQVRAKDGITLTFNWAQSQDIRPKLSKWVRSVP